MPQKPSLQRAMSSVSAGRWERQRPSTEAVPEAADCAAAGLGAIAAKAARLDAMATAATLRRGDEGAWLRGSAALLAFGAISLALLSIAVGAAALGSALGLAPLPHPLAILDVRLPVVFRIHMAVGGAGLVLLPFALALRRRQHLHRRLGGAASALLLVAALTGMPAALASEASWPARLGFLAQGMCCAVFLGLAWRAIRRRDAACHARRMACAAAILSGVIWLRLLVAAAVALQLPFDACYATIAWGSWLVPLALLLAWWRTVPRRSGAGAEIARAQYAGARAG
jgi:hypothetical protein